MASNCFTPIRGRRARVTNVDAAGRPVPGECGFVVTSGFVTVNITSEISEGETIEIKTAAGDICVSEQSCDTLTQYNVAVEFCLVDPDLFTMINPTWTKLFDYQGQTIGWEESHNFDCSRGIAVEIWQDVTGYTPTDPRAEGAWVYHLMPWVVGGTISDITIENAATSFTVNGRTKKGSQWGRGPFNVMRNPPVGDCGPLITPFNPEAPRRIFLTTCRPPEATCGCQPLSAPDGPSFTLNEVTDPSRRRVEVAVINATGTYRVSWGDSTPAEDLVPGTPKAHTYTTAGTYTVAVRDATTEQKVTFHQVTVPFTGTIKPAISLVEDPADTLDRRSVIATVDNHGNGAVRITWGQPGAPSSDNVGDGVATSPFTYAAPGLYTVRAEDITDGTLIGAAQVRVPFGQSKPVVTATPAAGKVVNVTVDNHGNGSVDIDWGDTPPAPTGTNAGDDVEVSTHTYATAGPDVTVAVVDPRDPSTRVTTTVTLQAFAEEAAVAERSDETDTTKRGRK